MFKMTFYVGIKALCVWLNMCSVWIICTDGFKLTVWVSAIEQREAIFGMLKKVKYNLQVRRFKNILWVQLCIDTLLVLAWAPKSDFVFIYWCAIQTNHTLKKDCCNLFEQAFCQWNAWMLEVMKTTECVFNEPNFYWLSMNQYPLYSYTFIFYGKRLDST